MKIFSLQSKWALVVWSVILAFCIYSIVFGIYSIQAFNCALIKNDWSCFNVFNERYRVLLPFGSMYQFIWANFLYWVLVVFIVLNLVNYFKKKKVPKPPKQN